MSTVEIESSEQIQKPESLSINSHTVVKNNVVSHPVFQRTVDDLPKRRSRRSKGVVRIAYDRQKDCSDEARLREWAAGEGIPTCWDLESVKREKRYKDAEARLKESPDQTIDAELEKLHRATAMLMVQIGGLRSVLVQRYKTEDV